MQRWQQLKPVDFLEVFPDSSGQLTIRVAESGGTIGEPVGPQTISYERTWHLEHKADQANLAWLLVNRLQPKVIHLGILENASEQQKAFAIKIARHQIAAGLGYR